MTKWTIPEIEVDGKDAYYEFNLYQREAKATAIFPKKLALEYTALGLVNEAGEYAGKIKKLIRDGTIDDKEAAKELGDVLWYLAVAADELGYDLSEIAAMNLKKLKSRQERGVLGGSGDNR